MEEPEKHRKGLFSWAVFDWAHSAFSVIVSTFVFPNFFNQAVVGSGDHGVTLWGRMVSASGLLIALLAPLLGAVADRTGRRKPWLFYFTYGCAILTACLWFVQPGVQWMWLGIILGGMAMLHAEFAMVFYNAMLPSLAPPERIGRWSGWGWALGYFGGVFCLLIALYGLIDGDAWLPLPRENAMPVRATFVLTGAWMILFSLPIFLRTPDSPKIAGVKIGEAMRSGFRQLIESIQHARRYAAIARFLVARMLYNDGLLSIFSFGGVYAGTAFGMEAKELILFGVALNISSGVGAVGFAWLDDWLGSKKTIALALVGLIACSTGILMVDSVNGFWVIALCVGLFVGPVQSASRSYMGRVAPAELRNEMFGLFAFSGKATAFLCPFFISLVNEWSQSVRVAMGVIPIFLLLGFLLLLTVPVAKKN